MIYLTIHAAVTKWIECSHDISFFAELVVQLNVWAVHSSIYMWAATTLPVCIPSGSV